MPLSHHKLSMARAKFYSPCPPHPNTPLLALPSCASSQSGPETMRPAAPFPFARLASATSTSYQLYPQNTPDSHCPLLPRTFPAGCRVAASTPVTRTHSQQGRGSCLSSTGTVSQVTAERPQGPSSVDFPHSRAQQCDKVHSCLSGLLSANPQSQGAAGCSPSSTL